MEQEKKKKKKNIDRCSLVRVKHWWVDTISSLIRSTSLFQYPSFPFLSSFFKHKTQWGLNKYLLTDTIILSSEKHLGYRQQEIQSNSDCLIFWRIIFIPVTLKEQSNGFCESPSMYNFPKGIFICNAKSGSKTNKFFPLIMAHFRECQKTISA